LPLETATLAGGQCKELFSASGRCSHVMKFPYKFEMKRVRVEPPITKNSKSQTILTHPSLNINSLTSRPHIFMAMGVLVEVYNTSSNSRATKEFRNILSFLYTDV
jgi:hypothetical protein